jgi:hypothetical protein
VSHWSLARLTFHLTTCKFLANSINLSISKPTQ